MDREELESKLGQDYEFRMRQIASQVVVDKGLLVDPKRVSFSVWEHMVGDTLVRALFDFATQEEEVFQYPADWRQAFKLRWFPAWLLKRYPVKYNHVWAIHKFPELNVPNEFVGREFVHFRVVKDLL